MSGCVPIWTSDNSGIFPLWIGTDVTPVFDMSKPCITFSMLDMNFGFTSEDKNMAFTSKNVDIVFTKTCL